MNKVINGDFCTAWNTQASRYGALVHDLTLCLLSRCAQQRMMLVLDVIHG